MLSIYYLALVCNTYWAPFIPSISGPTLGAICNRVPGGPGISYEPGDIP